MNENDSTKIKNNQNISMKPFSEVTEFHGHICPGSAIGYKAAKAGLNELNSHISEDEEIVTIVENLVALGRSAVAAIRDWWNSKKEFSAQGEQHKIFFKGNENDSAV